MKDELHLHKALKELEEYRAIGTVEEFKKAKDKQDPKEIYIYANGTEHCPNCDTDITQISFDDVYCSRCGQKLKKGD